MEDEEIKIPRAPLTRHDYGLLGLCSVSIGTLVLIVISLLLGGCGATSAPPEAPVPTEGWGEVAAVESVTYGVWRNRTVFVSNPTAEDIEVSVSCRYSRTDTQVLVVAGSTRRVYVSVPDLPAQESSAALCDVRWKRNETF